jgi:hypothetical protein
MIDHKRDCQTLISVHEDMLRLRGELGSSSIPGNVCERGYCLPDEDFWVKRMFATFLRHRQAVFDIIDRRRDYANKPFIEVAESFTVGFAAAVLLFRWSSIVVGSFKDSKPIRSKLNEADLGMGVQAEAFDLVHRNLTRVETQESLAEAAEFFELHESELKRLLSDDESIWLMDRIEENVQAIERDPWKIWTRRIDRDFDVSLRRTAKPFKRFLYKAQSLLFDVFGNVWFDHLPTIPDDHKQQFLELAKPGDFFLVRPELKSSTVFLPGWWTHGALYFGGEPGLKSVGAYGMPNVDRILSEINHASGDEPLTVMEALSAGVVLNPISRTFRADHALLLRPKLLPDELLAGLSDAFMHLGKPYDFEFDFSRSDGLVCTSLIYRA